MLPHFPYDDVGRNPAGQFVDDDGRQIELLFKLYSWELMTREAFGASLLRSDDDPKAATLGPSYVRKPLYSRKAPISRSFATTARP
jgi:glutathionylspermidine synthase